MHMSSKAKTTVKQYIVPELRFPKFGSAGNWERKALSSVLSFQAGFPFDSSGFNESHDGLRLIRNRDLRSDDTIIFYAKPFSDVYVVNDGDILVGMDGDFTPCVWRKGKALLNQRVGRITPLLDNNLKFLYYLLTLHLKLKEATTARTTVKHLAHSDIEDMFAYLPVISEQKKIADCLTSIDDLITAQNQKIYALKDHKKGLMQQLFPSEGEIVPKVRFAEFRHSGGWDKKRIGDKDFATLYKGKGISKADIVQDGKTPCIRYGELYTTYDEIIVDVVSRTNCSDSDIFLSRKNDVIIPASGETKIDIAKASCIKLSNVALGGDLNVIRSTHNGIFISYSLNGPLKREIAKVAQGDSVVHLYPSQLEKMEILVPGEKEQQKIADSLTSIDDLIREQSQKLDVLKKLKKGLMQQLFPNLSETEE